MRKALCVISGGMDSTLCAYLAKKEGYEIIALHLDYNQRTMNKERECFNKICKELNIQTKYILDVSFIANIGGNSLTDYTLEIPKEKLHEVEVPNTYVPFRNGIFLSIAGAIAEKEKCESIFIGVVQEDSSGYPDCSEKFIQKASKFINEGTTNSCKIQIKTPLVHLNKSQIVDLALKEKVALEYTWSCYEREDKACGKCDSCLLRLKGFQEANVKDFIEYV
ncbi:7-cyano-7-deazaguanine synthase [Campylobacter subantarcticus LMG 24377]|uniref:7-cyano-7-deazaguanine synthase n=2 Tax=Campylobacter subantarcticus TaxID=497724 RepID=A0A0A8HAC6_9BACT|nr:7-cyano-7-deazaguanine synthase QueC [Campylobacter subantarcticus]EAJ1260699.1 7-cyano-7-deazaguanine synthase QueC [Campylobacter lari]AJC90625.1 7-cyano-7-deazaguanine synthase [Campylobacter subantarcticus LMG 24374]AJC92385.1 7-cyano-7-deazaguanine synthase [Campylobacter subantarcticus LMG 24377]EAL3938608.1 7-cyano-7-deazaguanine synthase QueC [Campylobacter lari]MPB99556.1 7-cyano-7-deazaguanine synthase QueC [Campylobacter subantarcticus]